MFALDESFDKRCERSIYLCKRKKGGGVNVIDLANLNSCSFIETKDLGRLNQDFDFEILGRFDNSDLRGCNLMIHNGKNTIRFF
jgi:hypothetical protein